VAESFGPRAAGVSNLDTRKMEKEQGVQRKNKALLQDRASTGRRGQFQHAQKNAMQSVPFSFSSSTG